MEKESFIQLVESIADCRGQINNYREYIKNHPSCRFPWNRRLLELETRVCQLEAELQKSVSIL